MVKLFRETVDAAKNGHRPVFLLNAAMAAVISILITVAGFLAQRSLTQIDQRMERISTRVERLGGNCVSREELCRMEDRISRELDQLRLAPVVKPR